MASPVTKNSVFPLLVVLAALGLGALEVFLVPRPFGWGAAAATLWIALGCLPGVVAGTDGLWSTSKFQLFLWTGAIAYCLVTYVAYRRFAGPVGHPPELLPFPQMKSWMWVALGLSATTATAAKGITVGYIQANRLQASATTDSTKGGWLGLICDDNGVPEITKIQMLFWTILAVVYVVYEGTATIQSAIESASQISPGLPDLPVPVLVLTGLGQGVYLGDKLFDAEQPRITGLDQAAAKPGDTVTIYGSNFGPTFEGQRIELDGTGVTPISSGWSDTNMKFTVPLKLAGMAWPAAGKVVPVKVFVREVPSVNDTKLTITP